MRLRLKVRMKLGLGVLLLAECATGLAAQTSGTPAAVMVEAQGKAARAQIGFHYENQYLQPAKYTLSFGEDGAGEFHSEPGMTPPAESSTYHPLAQPLDRSIQLSSATTAKVFSIARGQRFFAIACEDKKNKVAFQGIKQLTYQGPDGSGSCTYNWSKLVSIEQITAILESIAFTLEEGRRLELERKHDRLSLDGELAQLIQAVKDGRALEVPTIQPTLQGIIDDETVMDRARTQARKLLGDAGIDTKSSASTR